MYQHILVAFDHTDSSKKALESAVQLLRIDDEAALTITHVSTNKTHLIDIDTYSHSRAVTPIMNQGLDRPSAPYMPPIPPADNGRSNQEYSDRLDNALLMAQEDLDARGIKAEFYPLSGSPAEAIVEYAYGNDVDLIIVGKTEKNTFQKWFLGSVSEKIVQEAHCNVLVIK
ncbi:universal stress protein [Jeotgalibacillus soli]|uniref:UspA domain-containing protein n=1 Tax=Jeotgalibacillus soli TaxID=889306 RepID=A0A0C2VS32_9BACL|nr:universal stress protein [Jeotgalibacillus soli]KIL46798.1 hypothetical protein KP78_19160 [Jeotgalibacillus soli]